MGVSYHSPTFPFIMKVKFYARDGGFVVCRINPDNLFWCRAVAIHRNRRNIEEFEILRL